MRPSAVKMKDRYRLRNIWPDDRRSCKNAVWSECTVPKWETIKAMMVLLIQMKLVWRAITVSDTVLMINLPRVSFCWAVECGILYLTSDQKQTRPIHIESFFEDFQDFWCLSFAWVTESQIYFHFIKCIHPHWLQDTLVGCESTWDTIKQQIYFSPA